MTLHEIRHGAYPVPPPRAVALRALAGADCSAFTRPPLEVFDALVREGSAKVIDSGDSVGWAITPAGQHRLGRESPS